MWTPPINSPNENWTLQGFKKTKDPQRLTLFHLWIDYLHTKFRRLKINQMSHSIPLCLVCTSSIRTCASECCTSWFRHDYGFILRLHTPIMLSTAISCSSRTGLANLCSCAQLDSGSGKWEAALLWRQNRMHRFNLYGMARRYHQSLMVVTDLSRRQRNISDYS